MIRYEVRTSNGTTYPVAVPFAMTIGVVEPGADPVLDSQRTVTLTPDQLVRAHERLARQPPLERQRLTGRAYPPWNYALADDIEAVLKEDEARA